jgi:hypothetical protein
VNDALHLNGFLDSITLGQPAALLTVVLFTRTEIAAVSAPFLQTPAPVLVRRAFALGVPSALALAFGRSAAFRASWERKGD